jgi:hypothetical protein
MPKVSSPVSKGTQAGTARAQVALPSASAAGDYPPAAPLSTSPGPPSCGDGPGDAGSEGGRLPSSPCTFSVEGVEVGSGTEGPPSGGTLPSDPLAVSRERGDLRDLRLADPGRYACAFCPPGTVVSTASGSKFCAEQPWHPLLPE